MIKSASRSSITSNEKYRSMSVGNVPSSEFLIQTIEVGATPLASVTFDNLAQFAGVYRHLQICMVARSTRSQTDLEEVGIRINGDTGANYSHHQLTGTANVAVASNATSSTTFGQIAVASGSINSLHFAGGVIDILDAFSTSKNKTMRGLSGWFGDGSSYRNLITLRSSAYFNTASVTSLTVLPQTSSFATGSRFSLYGVTA